MQSRIAKSVFILSSLVVIACGHICVFIPEQRGGYQMEGPGSDSCFQPRAPCGVIPPGNPVITLNGGTSFSIFMQQNLNHYNPGWPGFFDIAYAVGTNQTSDNDFTVLSTFPDFWPHFQATQTNLSFPFIVPNIDCDHCTLRIRYHPNKPTEPIFHQCADVTIVKTPPAPAKSGQIVALVQQITEDDTNTFVRIASDGELIPLNNNIRIGLRADSTLVDQILSQGLATTNPVKQQLYWIGDSPASFTADQAPNRLYLFDLNFAAMRELAVINRSSAINQWNSLHYTGNDEKPLLLVGQIPDGNDQYSYQIFHLYFNGTTQGPIATTEPDDTYVNFFWAELDVAANILYILSGDEDDLAMTDVRLNIINLSSGNSSYVLVDSSTYSVAAFHIDQSTHALYSISPGAANQLNPSHYLITINPTTGATKLVGQIAEANEYSQYYGGDVYNSPAQNGTIFKIFERYPDQVQVLLGINTQSGEIISSTALQSGLNSALKVQSPIFVASF